jgi:hypothetical protein
MEILFRNAPCPCGSGRKYKRCHGIEIPKASSTKRSAIDPSVYQLFASHGISPWAVGGMTKKVARQ